jgi:hypothetical protein
MVEYEQKIMITDKPGQPTGVNSYGNSGEILHSNSQSLESEKVKKCPSYDSCGFVKWRKDRPDDHITPLPSSGDCGKKIEDCGRLDPFIPIEINKYGPVTREELDITFPELSNTNNRPKRRLVGGGYR